MKNKKHIFGKIGEYIAIIYLKLKFYKIIKIDYKSKLGQIDIIAKKGKNLIFIEVKSRTNHKLLFDDIISKHQIYRIENSANFFITKNHKFQKYNICFDMILIDKYLRPKHIKNFID